MLQRVIIGAVLSVVAAVAYTFGNLVEKFAVEKMATLSVARAWQMVRSLASSRLWMAGFIVSLFGLGLQVIAFSRTPIIVVQAAFGGGIVLLVAGARGYLREPLRRSEVVGLCVAVPGIVLVGVSLGGSSSAAGSSASVDVVLATAAGTIAVAIASYCGLHRRFEHAGFLYGMTSGLAYGVASLGSKGASLYVIHDGVLGSVPKMLASPYPYVFVLASLLGLFAYQSGLQRCRISVVGPTSSVASSIYVVIVGTALFGEHLPSDNATLALRVFGFIAVVAGSFFLSGSEPTPSGPLELAADAPHLGLGSIEEPVAETPR